MECKPDPSSHLCTDEDCELFDALVELQRNILQVITAETTVEVSRMVSGKGKVEVKLL